MKTKFNFNSLILNLLILLFVFQPFIQSVIPIFSYLDEAVALLAIPVFFIKIAKNHFKIKYLKEDGKLFLALFGILIIGIVSNLFSNIQTIKYILGDILIFYKFFMIYYIARVLFKKSKINIVLIRIIIIFLFLGTLYDYAFSVNITGYLRYGIPSNYFIYGSPIGLVSVSSFILSCYLLENKKIDLFVILNCFVIFSTLRFKAFVFIIFTIVLYLYIIKFNKRINISKFLILGLIGFSIAYSQIDFYFFSSIDTTARGQLLVNSIAIMKDYMPLGTGFGTFASYMSGINYSILYYNYNLAGIYGLSPNYTAYLSDSFWPMIFAQFGIIGTILFIYCIKNLFNKIQKYDLKKDKYIYYAKMLAFVYMLISSVTESAFVNPVCIGFALVLGMRDLNE